MASEHTSGLAFVRGTQNQNKCTFWTAKTSRTYLIHVNVKLALLKITSRCWKHVFLDILEPSSECCAVTMEEEKQRRPLLLEVTICTTVASLCDFKSADPSLSLPLVPLPAPCVWLAGTQAYAKPHTSVSVSRSRRRQRDGETKPRSPSMQQQIQRRWQQHVWASDKVILRSSCQCVSPTSKIRRLH